MPAPRWLGRFNKRVSNRLLEPLARRLPYAGVVIHAGRKTGHQYRTPVLVFPGGDRYVIALTYGPDTDWVKNVLAAGGSALETRGRVLELRDPRLFHDERRQAMPAPVRVALGVLDVSDFLALTPARNASGETRASSAATSGTPNEAVTERRSMAAIGSALFFMAAPGSATLLVPWLLTGWRSRQLGSAGKPIRGLGAILFVSGMVVLVHAFGRFVGEGRGTPAPIAPPQRLVSGGAYRFVRNPMYLAILAVIVGQALLLGQAILLLYAAVLWLFAAAFVRWYEEPRLRRRFGADYDAYRRAVPAWRPRLRPWTPGEGTG